MSGGSKTKTHQSTSAPTWMDPYYKDLGSRTQTGVANIDRTPIKHAVAGANTFDQQSIMTADSMIKALMGQMRPGDFTNNAIASARGDFLDPSTNPHLRANIDASINPITEQLKRQILPGIRQSSIYNGAFGGDRQGLREGQATGDWAQAAGDISSRMIADNYTAERQNQINAAGQYQNGVAAELTPAMMLQALGEQQRGLDQLGLNDIMQTREFNNALQMYGLDNAANIYRSFPYSESTTTTQQKSDPLAQVLQAGLGIAAGASGLGWAPFAAKGVGGAAGSTDIGLAGMLGALQSGRKRTGAFGN